MPSKSIYTKSSAAELEALLHLRGLPTTGTKTQKLARLVNQDYADEVETKAFTKRVEEAMNGGTRPLSWTAVGGEENPMSGPGGEVQRTSGKALGGGRGKGGRSGRGGRGGTDRSSAGSELCVGKEGENESVDSVGSSGETPDAYIKSLVYGDSGSDTGIADVGAGDCGYGGIVVSMTPVQKKGAHGTWVTTGSSRELTSTTTTVEDRFMALMAVIALATMAAITALITIIALTARTATMVYIVIIFAVARRTRNGIR